VPGEQAVAAERRQLRAVVEAAYANFARMEQPLQAQLLAYLAAKEQARPRGRGAGAARKPVPGRCAPRPG
jgi:hypothetical protein